MRRLRSALVASSVLALGLTACGTSTPTETTTPTDPAPAQTSTTPAAPETEAPAPGDVPKGNGELIYLVSKGFQHRFWQAVNEGAQQAADEYGYKIQFVGPDDETKVTQQLDQLQAALDAQTAALHQALASAGLPLPGADPSTWLQAREAEWQHWQAAHARLQQLTPELAVQTRVCSAASAEAARLTALVQLYKALGGGWAPGDSTETQAPESTP